MEPRISDQGNPPGCAMLLTLRPYLHHSPFWVGMGLAISLVTFVCCAGMSTARSPSSGETRVEEQVSGKSPAEAVQAFLALAKKGQIDKVVLYYRRWEQPEVRSVIEEALIRVPDLEVTLRGAVLQEPVLELAKALDIQELSQRTRVSMRPGEIVDFGLALICYTREKEVIRVAISKRPPILSINGERFMLSPEVVYTLPPLLPSMVYRGMLAHVITQWTPRVPWHKLPEDTGDAFKPAQGSSGDNTN